MEAPFTLFGCEALPSIAVEADGPLKELDGKVCLLMFDSQKRTHPLKGSIGIGSANDPDEVVPVTHVTWDVCIHSPAKCLRDPLYHRAIGVDDLYLDAPVAIDLNAALSIEQASQIDAVFSRWSTLIGSKNPVSPTVVGCLLDDVPSQINLRAFDTLGRWNDAIANTFELVAHELAVERLDVQPEQIGCLAHRDPFKVFWAVTLQSVRHIMAQARANAFDGMGRCQRFYFGPEHVKPVLGLPLVGRDLLLRSDHYLASLRTEFQRVRFAIKKAAGFSQRNVLIFHAALFYKQPANSLGFHT